MGLVSQIELNIDNQIVNWYNLNDNVGIWVWFKLKVCDLYEFEFFYYIYCVNGGIFYI